MSCSFIDDAVWIEEKGGWADEVAVVDLASTTRWCDFDLWAAHQRVRVGLTPQCCPLTFTCMLGHHVPSLAHNTHICIHTNTTHHMPQIYIHTFMNMHTRYILKK